MTELGLDQELVKEDRRCAVSDRGTRGQVRDGSGIENENERAARRIWGMIRSAEIRCLGSCDGCEAGRQGPSRKGAVGAGGTGGAERDLEIRFRLNWEEVRAGSSAAVRLRSAGAHWASGVGNGGGVAGGAEVGVVVGWGVGGAWGSSCTAEKGVALNSMFMLVYQYQ